MTSSAVANALNASLLLDLLDSSDDTGKATGLLVTGGNVFGLLALIVTGYVIACRVVVLTLTRRPIITCASDQRVSGVPAAN